MDGNDKAFLQPGHYVESSAPAVVLLAIKTVDGLTTQKEKLVCHRQLLSTIQQVGPLLQSRPPYRWQILPVAPH